MKNNKIKIINLIICVLLIIMSFFNVVVSSDFYHIQHCDVESCEKCTLIYNAQNFLKNLAIIGITILAISFKFPKITRLRIKAKDFLLTTLVGSKVQFNE